MNIFKRKEVESPISTKTNDLQEQIDALASQLENALDENAQLYYEKSIIDSNGSNPITGEFGLVDEQYDKAMLQRLFMTETWFFIAVNTIAKTISSLPFRLEKRKVVKQTVRQANGDEDEVYKETWIEASAEPESMLFKYPNDMQGQMEFWYLIVADLLSTGDAYIHPLKDQQYLDESQPLDRLRNAIDRCRMTDVHQLLRLNSAMMEAVPSEEEDKILEGYAMVSDNMAVGFLPEEVVHIKLPNPSNPFYGLSPVVAVMKKVLLDRYTDEHHIRFYKQGARLGGAIETTKKLTKEQMNRLSATFEAKFTGKRQHHRTLILPEGMKYNTIEVSPVDTALIEFSKTNKEPILSAYNLPPIKVGLLDGATFANALIQNKTYYVDTIMPLTCLIEQAINRSDSIIKNTRDMRFRFDFSQIEALQEDFKAKSEMALGMLKSGATINEVREKVWELPPIEGGDVTPAMPHSGTDLTSLLSLNNAGDNKNDVANAQNDTEALSDVVPTEVTFESRVAQLINEAVAEGLDLGTATQRAIELAIQEGFTPTISQEEEEDEEKAASHIHVDSKGVRTGKAIPTGEEGLHYHLLFDEKGQEIGQTSSDKDDPRHTHSDDGGNTSGPRSAKFEPAPFAKDTLQEYMKVMSGQGVDTMIVDRKETYVGFMNRLKKLTLKKLKKKAFRKQKGFGIKIALPEPLEFRKFIKEESKIIAESLLNASKHGYKHNIPSKTMTFPNEAAIAQLEKIATRNVTSVVKTSLKGLKEIIKVSNEEQVSVQELASRIEDVFDNMTRSKAETIARTETLQAVSSGQDLKTQELKEQFPSDFKKLRRVWVTANDEKVRDSHEDLEGDVVKVGEKFGNGLEYPRQPGGEAKEVINCRCTFIDFLPEDSEAILGILSGGSPLS